MSTFCTIPQKMSRGVGCQKSQNLVNVVCERPLNEKQIPSTLQIPINPKDGKNKKNLYYLLTYTKSKSLKIYQVLEIVSWNIYTFPKIPIVNYFRSFHCKNAYLLIQCQTKARSTHMTFTSYKIFPLLFPQPNFVTTKFFVFLIWARLGTGWASWQIQVRTHCLYRFLDSQKIPASNLAFQASEGFIET